MMDEELVFLVKKKGNLMGGRNTAKRQEGGDRGGACETKNAKQAEARL